MDINIKHLAYQLLPPHKRQPLRRQWLSALLHPLAEQWTAFCKWRTDSRMLVNVNSQTGVLEGYLRAKYNEPVGIKIESFDDGLIPIALMADSEDRLLDFHSTETEVPVPTFPLSLEIRNRFDDADADFIVYIPAHLNSTLIAAEIDQYKQALLKYKLVQGD